MKIEDEDGHKLVASQDMRGIRISVHDKRDRSEAVDLTPKQAKQLAGCLARYAEECVPKRPEVLNNHLGKLIAFIEHPALIVVPFSLGSQDAKRLAEWLPGAIAYLEAGGE